MLFFTRTEIWLWKAVDVVEEINQFLLRQIFKTLMVYKQYRMLLCQQYHDVVLLQTCGCTDAQR